MNIIYWIHIIDNTGAAIFSFENPDHRNGIDTPAVLSHIIFALQTIAKTLNEDEIRGVDLGNDKYFITKEANSNYLFILKSNRDADFEVIKKVLQDLKDEFV